MEKNILKIFWIPNEINAKFRIMNDQPIFNLFTFRCEQFRVSNILRISSIQRSQIARMLSSFINK